MSPLAGHRPGQNFTYTDPATGDSKTVVQGSLDIDAGAALTIDGTDITDAAGALAARTSRAESTLAVAAEAGDAIAVTLTLKDAAGAAISGARPVKAWLSSSATTGALAVDDTITVTATTGLLVAEETDDLRFDAMTDVNGVLVLSVAHAGNSTAKYLWVDFPGEAPLVSAAIDLA